MAKCEQCGKEYEAKRSTSLYCSPKCKQTFYRNRMKPVTVTQATVTVSPKPDVTVTETKARRGQMDGGPRPTYPVQHHNPMMVGYEPLPQ